MTANSEVQDMDLDKFYTSIRNLLPYRGRSLERQYFLKRLKTALYLYKNVAKDCGIEKTVLDDISHISNRLLEIVSQYEKGLHSSAYIKLQNLIQGKVGLPPKIDLLKNTLTIDNKEPRSFFRIRLMDSVYEVHHEEMFHIPIGMRGKVVTHRYSAPGYPCLYLGKSIYGCWEEMRRPAMQNCAVSRLECNKPLTILDLSIPSKVFFTNPYYQKLIPLLISCMMPVADYNDTYKPEYTIPQLVIQWILKVRSTKKIDGVLYTSTHINDEFDFPEDTFLNYVFPAYSMAPHNKYCKRLCQNFKITYPTTNDLEKLKGGYPLDMGMVGISEEEIRVQNYETSDFGNLESRLKDANKFPLRSVSPK